MRLTRHLRGKLKKSNFVSIAFRVAPNGPTLSFRLWGEGHLLDFHFLRNDWDAPFVKSQLLMTSQLLILASRSPEIIGGVGVRVDFMKTLDGAQISQVGVHSPSDGNNLKVEKLLRKPSCSVMGRYDLFVRRKYLLPHFVNPLDSKWTRSTQCLRKVTHFWSTMVTMTRYSL